MAFLSSCRDVDGSFRFGMARLLQMREGFTIEGERGDLAAFSPFLDPSSSFDAAILKLDLSVKSKYCPCYQPDFRIEETDRERRTSSAWPFGFSAVHVVSGDVAEDRRLRVGL